MADIETVLDETYATCISNIEMLHERIACLEFAFRNHSDQYYSHENKEQTDAYCTLMSELRRKLNEAYSQFFIYQNLFTKKQQQLIDKKIAEKYQYAYKEIVKRSGISEIPKPKYYRLGRDGFINEIKRIQTKENADKIIDELSKDLT